MPPMPLTPASPGLLGGMFDDPVARQTLLGLGAGLLNGSRHGLGAGLGQGLLYGQQFGTDAARTQLYQKSAAREEEQFNWEKAETERKRAAEDAQKVAQAEYLQDKPPEMQRMLMAGGPDAFNAMIQNQLKPVTPYSELAQIQADIEGGRLSPEAGQAAIRKATYIAPTQGAETWGAPQQINGQWFQQSSRGELKPVGGNSETYRTMTPEEMKAAGLPTGGVYQVSTSGKITSAADTRDTPTFKNEGELRKEFEGLPEVKSFKQIVPVYNSAIKSAGQDTRAADLDLVFAVGKTLDPDSVVREGEQVTITRTGSPAEQVSGFINYLQGGGKFTADMRQNLLQLLSNRASEWNGIYRMRVKDYRDLAKGYQLDPGNVVGEFPELQAAKIPEAPASLNPAPPMPAMPVPPTPGGRVSTYEDFM
jgi:hypothetical protein